MTSAELTINNDQAGSVGVFLTAVVDEAIIIRDVPVQEQTTASINVVYVTLLIQSQQLLTVDLLKQN
jgi:hypothetical protein